MLNKDDEELVKKFLKNNDIEVIPPVEEKKKKINVSPKKMKVSDLMSIGDAIDTLGEKRKVKRRKVKIQKDLIPDSLQWILEQQEKNNKVEVK